MTAHSYTDLETNTFNLGFIRDISNILESTKATMNMGYAKYNMPGMKIDNYEATIGIDHAFNEKWNLAPQWWWPIYKFEDLPIRAFSLTPLPLLLRERREQPWIGVQLVSLPLPIKENENSGSISVIHRHIACQRVLGLDGTYLFCF